MAQGLVRTFLIFTDLPKHIEFRATPMPLLQEGTVIHFELVLTDPSDSRRKRDINGPYELSRRVLRYSSEDDGLRQYLEWVPRS